MVAFFSKVAQKVKCYFGFGINMTTGIVNAAFINFRKISKQFKGFNKRRYPSSNPLH